MHRRWMAGTGALALLVAAGSAQAARCGSQGELRAMTYNIRLDVASDGLNAWPYRRLNLIGQIRLLRPAILGLQEVVPGQYADLRAALPGYAFTGGGRDDGAGQGEASPLAVDRSVLTVVASGMFWLSPSPERPSLGWDAAYRRVATWAQLRRRSDGLRILAINTHWDHVGAEARRQGALQMRQWIAANRRGGQPVVVLGDFNATLGEASLAVLLDRQGAGQPLADARAAAREPAGGSASTFNGFDPLSHSGPAIDHILTGGLGVARHYVLAEQFAGRVASDHFPVIADLAPACRP